MTEQEQATPASDVAAEHSTNTPVSLRDQMVADAKAAREKSEAENPAEEESEPVDPDNEGSPVPGADDDVAEAKPEPTIARLQRELRDKEKKRLEEKSARQNAAQQAEYQRQFAAQQASLEQERKQLEAERARLREIQKDPMKVAEFAGMTHEQLAQNLAMAGTPEWQESQRIRTQLDEMKAQQVAQQKSWEEHQAMLSQQRKQYEEHAALEHRKSNEKSFVEHASDGEKYPTLANLSGRARLAIGYEFATELSEQLGRVANDEELASYIEHVFSEEGGSKRDGARQQAGANGKAPTVRASGSRTLSTSMASERRSSPKPESNNWKSPEDRKRDLLAAAREAKKSATG